MKIAEINSQVAYPGAYPGGGLRAWPPGSPKVYKKKKGRERERIKRKKEGKKGKKTGKKKNQHDE